MHVTTNIAADCRKVLRLRTPQFVGCAPTLGEFIEALRRLGLRDDDVISSIEFGVSAAGSASVMADTNEHGHFDIKEG